MHIILENHSNQLAADFGHEDLTQSKKFEIFCNYCVVSKHFFGRFDPITITTDEDDASLDGVAIIIDGDLIRTADDATEVFKTHKTNLSAEVIITQVKTGESFQKSEIANFKIGIEDYLSLNPKLPNGTLNKETLNIFKILLKNLNKIKNRRPNIRIYYCTTGVYNAEPEIKAVFDIIEKYTKQSEFFHTVEVEPLGRGEILRLYTNLTEKNEARLEILEYFGMPKMPNIPQSYVAVVNAGKLVDKLLKDDAGNIRESVFEENIRSYLGEDNDVNLAIQDTLQNADKKSLFSVLNNGITIVSPEMTLTPNTKEIHLINYQIINGCQTSSTLFTNREHLTDSVNVVVKFIESSEADASSDIIAATNSQSEISKEAFYSLRNKAKMVQKYFNIQNEKNSIENHIFFERRQGEYRNSGSQLTRIFDVREIARCYAAMFLDTPHNSARYVSRIFSTSGDNLFKDSDHESYYYAASLALYRYQSLINGKKINAPLYTKLRWHVIQIFKWVATGKIETPQPNSGKAEAYANKIIQILNSEKRTYIQLFEKCQEIINSIGFPTDDEIKRGKFTADLMKATASYISQQKNSSTKTKTTG